MILSRTMSTYSLLENTMRSKVIQQSEGEIVRHPEGEVVRQTKFFQSIQPIPNPVRDRSGRLDDM